MVVKIIDGKMIVQQVCFEVVEKVKVCVVVGKCVSGLVVVLVGSNLVLQIYVGSKCKVCEEVGFVFCFYDFLEIISEVELLEFIDILNVDKIIDGILVQLFLLVGIDNVKVFECIVLDKDVDGFYFYNVGCLCQCVLCLCLCILCGIVILLECYNIDIYGFNVVVIGVFNIVGCLMSMELLLVGCIIIVIYCFIKNLCYYVENVDLLIVVVGKLGFISGEWIKEGVIVVDVGINCLESGKVVGDVVYEDVVECVFYIILVFGGVGLMIVVILIQNMLQVCEEYYDVEEV